MIGSASVDIQLTAPAERYSRNLFGHFIEHFHRQVYGGLFQPGSALSDERGFRLDVIEAMRELRPSIVRWPGGCFVSSYHWLDGVGDERRSHYDKAWRVTDPNTFGTAEFVGWCAAIGAEPYICTNAGTGTAEEMSDWVEYCNLPAGHGRWSDLRARHGRPAPLDVRYWSIGNENYGSWEMGAKDPHEWSRLVTESAKMMRRVDEDAVLLTAARADLDWMLPLLDGAGPYLDMLSIHGYWDVLHEVNEPSDYLTALSKSLGPQDDIERTRHIIGAAGLPRTVTIAFDEWNLRGWHHPSGNSPQALAARDENDDNSTYTMADALFTASFLNTCLRNADVVTMANIAPSINTRGPLFVHDDGVVRRTTFHVMAMYASLLGELALSSNADSPSLEGAGVPVLDHLATLHEETGTLSVVLVNRHPSDDLPCELAVAGQAVTGDLEATVLRGPAADAYNDVDAPSTVEPERTRVRVEDGRLVLPPHSVTVCDIVLPVRRTEGVIAAQPRRNDWYLDHRVWRRSA